MAEKKKGRPRIYDPEKCKADVYIQYCMENDLIPTVIGWANFIGISRSTLHRWRKSRKGFNTEYTKVHQTCQDLLIQGGAKNKLNSGFCKFLLSAMYGLNETQQVITKDLKAPKDPEKAKQAKKHARELKIKLASAG